MSRKITTQRLPSCSRFSRYSNVPKDTFLAGLLISSCLSIFYCLDGGNIRSEWKGCLDLDEETLFSRIPNVQELAHISDRQPRVKKKKIYLDISRDWATILSFNDQPVRR